MSLRASPRCRAIYVTLAVPVRNADARTTFLVSVSVGRLPAILRDRLASSARLLLYLEIGALETMRRRLAVIVNNIRPDDIRSEPARV